MVGPGPGAAPLENANPLIYRRSGERPVTAREEDDELPDAIDDREIFDLIRSINDPEHPLTLEELNVVEQVRVKVNDAESTVSVEFTPTIPHCSMATLIGLSIKVKLIRSLPERFKLDVHITPGTHASEHAGNLCSQRVTDLPEHSEEGRKMGISCVTPPEQLPAAESRPARWITVMTDRLCL
ncbi:cytosolic iron-sulfur assembly component 2B isoform X1 [Corvus cornix cornix]|uniref:cytosolic iron-sulfur assembly component 2B isoform X1 n=1 Tax=Corvus cornix cornix TaxID=932674 RepID=UPI0019527672|nr:cytosolic iron-sulfur assembly component 2B isoform X1 [Corvus cornix cornix]